MIFNIFALARALGQAAHESYLIEEKGSRKGRHPFHRSNREHRTMLAAVYLVYRQELRDQMKATDPRKKQVSQD